MPECKKCGEPYEEGDVFCGKCGQELEEKEPEKPIKEPVTAPEPPVETPRTVEETLPKEEPKKGKPDLTEEEKSKIRRELEGSIKAFKRGEITLEEFQRIKESIIAKAKSGKYEKAKSPEPLPPPSPKIAPPPPKPRRYAPQPTGQLYQPVRREDELPYSRLWYLAPILLNLIGGVIAYFSIKKVDERDARKLLLIGVATFFLLAGGGGYYLSQENLWPFEEEAVVPGKIVIVTSSSSTEPLIPSDTKPEDVNLKLDDLEENFYTNRILTGTLTDPIEFSAGDEELLDELKTNGWIENHRAVFKKDFTILSSGENITVTEKEIDVSISKYNTNLTSRIYLEGKLTEFEEKILDEGYGMLEFTINESGKMGKKVEQDQENDITLASYRLLFYNHDTLVSLSARGVVRGISEEEIKGYAELIAGNIK